MGNPCGKYPGNESGSRSSHLLLLAVVSFLGIGFAAANEDGELAQVRFEEPSQEVTYAPPDTLEQDKIDAGQGFEIRFRPDYVIYPAPGVIAESDPDDPPVVIRLLQFRGPIRREWRGQLETLGVAFHEYLQDYAFLAEVPDPAWDSIYQMIGSGVLRHVGHYPDHAKLDMELANVPPMLGLNVDVVVQLYRPLDPQQTSQLADVMNIQRVAAPPLHEVRGQVDASNIDSLAALTFVRHALVDEPAEPHNFEGALAIGADRVQFKGDYLGQDVRVAVVDTGIARTGLLAQCGAGGAAYHSDLPAHRIFDERDFQNGDANACDDHSHGTHTAGTIAGSGYDNPTHMGIAPAADLLIYKDCCNSSGTGFGNFDSVLGRAANNDAHVVGNSWGGGNGNYNSNSIYADRAVLGDYDGPNDEPQYMFLSISAGNDNDFVSAPGTAKNAVTVGAMKDGNPDGISSACFCVNNNDNACSSTCSTGASCGDDFESPRERICFSNWGPLDTDGDGRERIKPDIMAPGTMTTSTWAAHLSSTGDQYGPKNGTSMSQPMVAGTAALMLSAYSSLEDWPAMIKARMLATATSLGDTAKYGHGMLDAHHSVYNSSSLKGLEWAGSRITGTGNEKSFTFTVPSGFLEVRVYLTWADEEGSSGTEVVNDLDLRVYDSTGSAVGYSLSYDDTVEWIRTSSGTAGEWEAVVRGYNVPYPDARFGIVAVAIVDEEELVISADASETCVQPGDEITVETTVSNGGISKVAAEIALDLPDDGSFELSTVTLTSQQAERSREIDETDLEDDSSRLKYWVTVGEVNQSFNRKATWNLSVDPSATDGLRVVYAEVGAVASMGDQTSENIRIDGSGPGMVSGLTSGTHAVDSCSDVRVVSLSWSAAADAGCGLGGYAKIWSTGAPAEPPEVQSLAGTETTFTTPVPFSDDARYFNIRAVDAAGNWASSYASYGPIYVDQVPLAITNLTLTKSGSDTVLTWNPAPVANVYRVYRDTTPAFTSAVQVGSDVPAGTTTLTDTGAAASTTSYYYKVVGANVCGLEGP